MSVLVPLSLVIDELSEKEYENAFSQSERSPAATSRVTNRPQLRLSVISTVTGRTYVAISRQGGAFPAAALCIAKRL